MPITDRNLNRQVLNTLYMLKRRYGGDFDLYRRGPDGATNHKTGVVTVDKTNIPIKRGIILPAKVIRESVQTLSIISANKAFVIGGTYDSSTRMFIVDRRDVPNLELKDFQPTPDDWIVYKGRKYEITHFTEFEFDSAWVFTGRAVLGDVPEQIFLPNADNLIRVNQSVDQSAEDMPNGITPPSFTNLENWWDANDASTFIMGTGPDVNSWTDKIGGIVASQLGVDALKPHREKAPTPADLNNRQVVRFDGIDDKLLTTSALDFSNEEETLILVGKFPANATVEYLLAKVGGDTFEFAFYRSGTGNFRRGDSIDNSGAITVWAWTGTDYHILVFRRKRAATDSELTVWEGGGASVKTATHTKQSTETGAMYMGASSNGSSNYDCELSDIIRYTRRLSFGEIDSLCLNYLVPKWGGGVGEPNWTPMTT